MEGIWQEFVVIGDFGEGSFTYSDSVEVERCVQCGFSIHWIAYEPQSPSP